MGGWNLSGRGFLAFGLAIAGIGVVGATLPVAAAERVVLKYSILRESISVAELSRLARQGEVSPALKSYLALAKKRPQDLRQLLNRNLDVDPVLLSKVLKSFAGDFLLDQVSEVVYTPSQRASRESMRGALVSSALPDGNIRLIEVLENYPTAEVHVDGDRLAEFHQQIQGAISRLPRLPF